MKKGMNKLITVTLLLAALILPTTSNVYGAEIEEMTASEEALISEEPSTEDLSISEEPPAEELSTNDDTFTADNEALYDGIDINFGSKSNVGSEALDLKDDVLQYGGFPSGRASKSSTGSSGSTASASGIGSNLCDAFKCFERSVDVSAYELSRDVIKDEIINVLNNNPSFFYVQGAKVSVDEKSGTVSRLDFDYVTDVVTSSDKYEKEVANILSGIDDSWPDDKKLMYIHDFLVTHAQYDLTYSRYSAYDIIVDHSGVCQAYALAFMDLAKRAGIPTSLVSSHNLNHAWNVVKLGSKRYFVDVTWDDPIGYGPSGEDAHLYKAHCEHKDFLGSNDKMVALGHTSTDWYCDGENISGKYNNKKYDDAPWKSAFNSKALFMDGDRIMYLEDGRTSHPKLCETDVSGSKDKKILELDNLSYNAGARTMVEVNGHIFMNDDSNIYVYNAADNKLVTYYTLKSSEKQKGSIYGIDTEGSKIRYDLAKGESDKEFVKSGYLKVGDVDTVKSITLSTYDIAFKEAGETCTITATISPAGADKVKWTTSDPDVATVKDGVVTAVGRGRAQIRANAGMKSCECYVTVGDAIRIDRSSLDLYVGQTQTLTAKYVNHEPKWYDGIQWESDDTSIATVSEEGLVTGIKPGTTTICAWDMFSLYGYCTVTVRDKKPEKPQIVSLENTKKGIKATWSTSFGATEYELQRSENGKKYTKIATVKGTSYTDKKATKNGTKYSYKVRAYRTEGGKTYKSGPSSAKTGYSLDAGKIKSYKNSGKKTVNLKWKRNTKCSGYEIQYDTNKKFTNAKTISVSSNKTTSHDIKKLKKKKTYYFRIRPFKKVKGTKYYGAWSSSKKVKVKK